MTFIKVEVKKLPIQKSDTTQSLGLSRRLTHTMYLHTMEVFDQEGPGWTPLSARTRKQRVARGFDEGPILDRKRGNLGLRGGIVEAPSETEAVVGVREGIPYALAHQFGVIINRVVKAGSVRLRTNKKGELIRQKNYKNLAVFGKKSHKLTKDVSYPGGKAYQIKIPQRKYLFFNDALIEKLKTVAIEFLSSK